LPEEGKHVRSDGIRTDSIKTGRKEGEKCREN
jgi:hypothetical protein